jgi:hypothetical protein
VGRYLLSTSARRFFLSDPESGLIGLGPRHAEAGDIIVVLAGGRVPVIMRPNGSRWQFIGDSYAHGIIHGEALSPDEEMHEFTLF